MRYAVINNPDEKTRRDLFAPVALANAAAGGPLPAGTVLIMEVYKATLDAYKDPIIEADGNFRVGRMDAAWVMEKQDGWGDDGGAGDWGVRGLPLNRRAPFQRRYRWLPRLPPGRRRQRFRI